jgi:serine/threonine protein kinase
VFCSSLKSGSSATVCRGTHRANGKKVAINCVLRRDLPPSDDAAIYEEVAILSSLDHAYIAPFIDFFDEKDFYLIVMELMSISLILSERKRVTAKPMRETFLPKCSRPWLTVINCILLIVT